MEKKLYLVTDSYDYSEDKFLSVVDQALRAGVKMLQLREKEKTDREVLALGKKLKALADSYGVPLIIDDRLDVAMILGCGVHLGQGDIPVVEARKLMGKDAIIGATTKTLDQAKRAEEEGASYLGVGAIYPTTTKVVTKITSRETLKEIIDSVSLPVFAIGGLNAENLSVLEGLGLSGICVVSAIMKAKDPYKESKILLDTLGALG